MCFIGIVAFPTAMVNKDENILKCTPCGEQFCPSDFTNHDHSELGSFLHLSSRNDTENSTDMLNELSLVGKAHDAVNDDWVNAFCLNAELGMQVQYFPFVVLIMAISLCLVQKISNT